MPIAHSTFGQYGGIAAPALSGAGTGRIYYDLAANLFRYSANGGAYADLTPAGGVAPADAAYLTQGAVAGLSAEVDFTAAGAALTWARDFAFSADNARSLGAPATTALALYSRLVAGRTPAAGDGSEVRLRGGDAGGAGPNIGGNAIIEVGAGVGGGAHGDFLVRNAVDSITRFRVTDAGEVVAPTIGPAVAQQHTLPAVASDTVALLAAVQVLSGKTLTTPTIASFVNAGHNHQAAAGGGTLDHGLALTGLGDDDHTIYLLASGARALSGSMSVGGNDLTSIDELEFSDAALAASAVGRLRRNGTSLEYHDGTASRVVYKVAGLDVSVLDGGTGASVAADARTNLGLAIGTNVQAFDAGLLSLAAFPTVADRIAYSTALDVWAETALTAFARTVLDDVDAATVQATLAVPPNARTISAGDGLSGGGDLSANRSLAVDATVLRTADVRIADLSPAAEAANVIAVTVNVVNQDGGAISAITRLVCQLYDASFLHSLTAAFRLAETGLGTEVTTSARASLVIDTDANGDATLSITDVVGASAAIIWLLVTPVVTAAGFHGQPTLLSVTFDGV